MNTNVWGFEHDLFAQGGLGFLQFVSCANRFPIGKEKVVDGGEKKTPCCAVYFIAVAHGMRSNGWSGYAKFDAAAPGHRG